MGRSKQPIARYLEVGMEALLIATAHRFSTEMALGQSCLLPPLCCSASSPATGNIMDISFWCKYAMLEIQWSSLCGFYSIHHVLQTLSQRGFHSTRGVHPRPP